LGTEGAVFVVLKEQFSDNVDTIHFTIHVDENSPVSSCQLVRQRCPASEDGRLQYADGFTYRLYVDQTPIIEHAVDAALRVGVPEDLHTGTTAASPPTYNETVDDVDNMALPPYDA